MSDQKKGLKVGRREFWQEAMARWQSSGLSVRRFCEGEGLCTASFYGWRRRLLGGGASKKVPSKFIEVSLPIGPESGLELVLSSGHLLRISSEVDGVLLDRVLHSLREANLC